MLLTSAFITFIIKTKEGCFYVTSGWLYIVEDVFKAQQYERILILLKEAGRS
jgi:hypothetical protein